MSEPDTTTVMEEQLRESGLEKVPSGEPIRTQIPPTARGRFDRYKPNQGEWTRNGTFAGCLLLVVWGGYFLWDRLAVLEGDELWRMLVRVGVPLGFIAGFTALSWWLSYSHSRSSDFMIATEGEMKKVNWSTRGEVIGSTKVVIALVVLMAVLLFSVDLVFQWVFRSIGILKTG